MKRILIKLGLSPATATIVNFATILGGVAAVIGLLMQMTASSQTTNNYTGVVGQACISQTPNSTLNCNYEGIKKLKIKDFVQADMQTGGKKEPGDCSIKDQIRRICVASGLASCEFTPQREHCTAEVDKSKYKFVKFSWLCSDGSKHSHKVNLGEKHKFSCR